jgi:hypothetical protein
MISSCLISITGCGSGFFISGIKTGLTSSFFSSFGVTAIGGGTNVFCTGFSSTVIFFVSTGCFKFSDFFSKRLQCLHLNF